MKTKYRLVPLPRLRVQSLGENGHVVYYLCECCYKNVEDFFIAGNKANILERVIIAERGSLTSVIYPYRRCSADSCKNDAWVKVTPMFFVSHEG